MSKQWKMVKSINPKHERRQRSISKLESFNYHKKIRSRSGCVIGLDIQKSKRDLYGNLIAIKMKGALYE